MDLKQELAALLGANVPLVNLITYEEERVLRTLGRAPACGRAGHRGLGPGRRVPNRPRGEDAVSG